MEQSYRNRDTNRNEGHRIHLENRKDGEFTGIIDVISFDVDEIVLESKCGGIIIKGSELHVKNVNLERGEVNIEGNVDSLCYTKSKLKSNESLLKKLFK